MIRGRWMARQLGGWNATRLVASWHTGDMLFSAPRLDAKDRRVLAELETFAEELDSRVAEPRRWIGQLRRSLTAAAIRCSNSIEGYTISESNAAALAAGEPMPEAVD